MSDYPYTDEHVEVFSRAIRPLGLVRARRVMDELAGQGIKVMFPESRFHVVKRHESFDVCDRTTASVVATFWGAGTNSEGGAREYAARLNQKDAA